MEIVLHDLFLGEACVQSTTSVNFQSSFKILEFSSATDLIDVKHPIGSTVHMMNRSATKRVKSDAPIIDGWKSCSYVSSCKDWF